MEQQLQELSRKMDESKDTFGVALRNIKLKESIKITRKNQVHKPTKVM